MSAFQIAALGITAFIPLALSWFSIQILRSKNGAARARRMLALALIPAGAIAALVATAAPALVNAEKLSSQAFAETSINLPASLVVAIVATALSLFLVTRVMNRPEPIEV